MHGEVAGGTAATCQLASAAAAAFEQLVAHSNFLDLVMSAPEEQLPSAAAASPLPLTSLMFLVDIDDPSDRQV